MSRQRTKRTLRRGGGGLEPRLQRALLKGDFSDEETTIKLSAWLAKQSLAVRAYYRRKCNGPLSKGGAKLNDEQFRKLLIELARRGISLTVEPYVKVEVKFTDADRFSVPGQGPSRPTTGRGPKSLSQEDYEKLGDYPALVQHVSPAYPLRDREKVDLIRMPWPPATLYEVVAQGCRRQWSPDRFEKPNATEWLKMASRIGGIVLMMTRPSGDHRCYVGDQAVILLSGAPCHELFKRAVVAVFQGKILTVRTSEAFLGKYYRAAFDRVPTNSRGPLTRFLGAFYRGTPRGKTLANAEKRITHGDTVTDIGGNKRQLYGTMVAMAGLHITVDQLPRDLQADHEALVKPILENVVKECIYEGKTPKKVMSVDGVSALMAFIQGTRKPNPTGEDQVLKVALADFGTAKEDLVDLYRNADPAWLLAMFDHLRSPMPSKNTAVDEAARAAKNVESFEGRYANEGPPVTGESILDVLGLDGTEGMGDFKIEIEKIAKNLSSEDPASPKEAFGLPPCGSATLFRSRSMGGMSGQLREMMEASLDEDIAKGGPLGEEAQKDLEDLKAFQEAVTQKDTLKMMGSVLPASDVWKRRLPKIILRDFDIMDEVTERKIGVKACLSRMQSINPRREGEGKFRTFEVFPASIMAAQKIARKVLRWFVTSWADGSQTWRGLDGTVAKKMRLSVEKLTKRFGKTIVHYSGDATKSTDRMMYRMMKALMDTCLDAIPARCWGEGTRGIEIQSVFRRAFNYYYSPGAIALSLEKVPNRYRSPDKVLRFDEEKEGALIRSEIMDDYGDGGTEGDVTDVNRETVSELVEAQLKAAKKDFEVAQMELLKEYFPRCTFTHAVEGQPCQSVVLQDRLKLEHFAGTPLAPFAAEIVRAWRTNQKLAMMLPTGAGKSTILMAVLAKAGFYVRAVQPRTLAVRGVVDFIDKYVAGEVTGEKFEIHPGLPREEVVGARHWRHGDGVDGREDTSSCLIQVMTPTYAIGQVRSKDMNVVVALDEVHEVNPMVSSIAAAWGSSRRPLLLLTASEIPPELLRASGASLLDLRPSAEKEELVFHDEEPWGDMTAEALSNLSRMRKEKRITLSIESNFDAKLFVGTLRSLQDRFETVSGGPLTAIVFGGTIKRCEVRAAALRQVMGDLDFEVRVVHGQLDPEEINRRLVVGEKPVIVVSSAIMTTSYTLPGAILVWDCRRQTTEIQDPTSLGLSLGEVKITEDTERQRRGRAGRMLFRDLLTPGRILKAGIYVGAKDVESLGDPGPVPAGGLLSYATTAQRTGIGKMANIGVTFNSKCAMAAEQEAYWLQTKRNRVGVGCPERLAPVLAGMKDPGVRTVITLVACAAFLEGIPCLMIPASEEEENDRESDLNVGGKAGSGPSEAAIIFKDLKRKLEYSEDPPLTIAEFFLEFMSESAIKALHSRFQIRVFDWAKRLMAFERSTTIEFLKIEIRRSRAVSEGAALSEAERKIWFDGFLSQSFLWQGTTTTFPECFGEPCPTFVHIKPQAFGEAVEWEQGAYVCPTKRFDMRSGAMTTPWRMRIPREWLSDADASMKILSRSLRLDLPMPGPNTPQPYWTRHTEKQERGTKGSGIRALRALEIEHGNVLLKIEDDPEAFWDGRRKQFEAAVKGVEVFKEEEIPEPSKLVRARVDPRSLVKPFKLTVRGSPQSSPLSFEGLALHAIYASHFLAPYVFKQLRKLESCEVLPGEFAFEGKFPATDIEEIRTFFIERYGDDIWFAGTQEACYVHSLAREMMTLANSWDKSGGAEASWFDPVRDEIQVGQNIGSFFTAQGFRWGSGGAYKVNYVKPRSALQQMGMRLRLWGLSPTSEGSPFDIYEETMGDYARSFFHDAFSSLQRDFEGWRVIGGPSFLMRGEMEEWPTLPWSYLRRELTAKKSTELSRTLALASLDPRGTLKDLERIPVSPEEEERAKRTLMRAMAGVTNSQKAAPRPAELDVVLANLRLKARNLGGVTNLVERELALQQNRLSYADLLRFAEGEDEYSSEEDAEGALGDED